MVPVLGQEGYGCDVHDTCFLPNSQTATNQQSAIIGRMAHNISYVSYGSYVVSPILIVHDSTMNRRIATI